MASSVITSSAVTPLPRSETRPRLPQGDLRKAEIDTWNLQIGRVIEGLRLSQGWSLKEFANKLGRHERQVARWINGKEHPQLDTIFAVECLRQPLVVALAALAKIETETVLRIRLTA